MIGLSKSMKKDILEFIVHVKDEYDYRFECKQQDTITQIFDACKYAYWQRSGKNIPVYGVPELLKEFSTSKKDISSGLNVIPPLQYRLKSEDVYQESGDSQMSTSGSSFKSNSSTNTNDEISQFNNEFAKVRSNTLFMKNKNETKADLKDFKIISVIGKGSFGKVFLVQKIQNKMVYAMKSLRKDVILDYDQIESTLLEKDILMKADHPFLVGMEYVFQTDQKIFFVMKFVRGGELFMHLRKAKQFTEDQAKFYAMTVALALGHLHSQKIIYRDLKPENILMGEDGYICLTDFGLAKILEQNEQAYSFCGTPEYLAPEILTEQGHSFPVDWWALGILTYEMIVGFPPFYTGNSNNNKMYDLIKSKPVFFPDAKKHGIAMSDNCKDFINKCLTKKPDTRIGSKNGVQDVLSHPWFASIDQNALVHKTIQPSFKPKLSKDACDISNFDKMFTSEEAVHSVLPMSAQKKINKVNAKFSGFDQS